MEINKCIGDFWSVSADPNENITISDVKKLLIFKNIKWNGATTKYRVSKGPMFCTWTKPEDESIIKLNFGQTKHPYLALLFARTLNDWGYTCYVMTKNGRKQEKFVFRRPEYFTEDELRSMMKID